VLGQSFRFSPEKWREALPDPVLWPPELDALPVADGSRWPQVDRRAVFRVAERANERVGAAQTFVAAAVWGTGTAALGRVRRLRAFDADRDVVVDHLATAVQTLGTKGPVEAYDYLHGNRENLVRYLGPSFGTKVLYFAGYGNSASDRRPLILDQYVALAINRLCGLDWSIRGDWTTAQYAEYLDLAHSWAIDWRTGPDVIERVLFSVGKASPLVMGVFTGLPLF
jgi:hypothetical protein